MNSIHTFKVSGFFLFFVRLEVREKRWVLFCIALPNHTNNLNAAHEGCMCVFLCKFLMGKKKKKYIDSSRRKKRDWWKCLKKSVCVRSNVMYVLGDLDWGGKWRFFFVFWWSRRTKPHVFWQGDKKKNTGKWVCISKSYIQCTFQAQDEKVEFGLRSVLQIIK